MVVLEGGGMLSSAGNQYLQPDYLSPLPTTLDAKKSPLALLAQTCSQIGADTPSSKPLISPEKPKKAPQESATRSSPAKSEKAQRSSPSETKLAFKPYENTVVTKKEERSPSTKSATPQEERKPDTPQKPTSPVPETGKTSPEKSASPIIRSGLEILQGHKDPPLTPYKPTLPSTSALSNPLCCPPLEHTNPAFRPPFPGAPFSPLSYSTPYLSYARVKTPSGGEALVPVCKDPYCTSCQFSSQLMGGACPSGCTQCDHQKYNLAMAMSMVPPYLGRPYVCNWIAGDAYCGKRFVTSEELLQHLRTHTSDGGPLTPFRNGAYPNAPLSPLSGRYHPYAKPPPLPPLGAYSAFNPALGAYYPYVYGQRLGAAVHP